MSEDNKPRPGERVRVTFEGTVETVDDHGRVGRIQGNSPEGAWLSYIPEFAAVEVLEPADDAPHLPVAEPDAYPHYYQSDDFIGELWRVDGPDEPVMWREDRGTDWVESTSQTEEKLVAMQGGHIHRYFGEVPS